jgi:hypothetical protein
MYNGLCLCNNGSGHVRVTVAERGDADTGREVEQLAPILGVSNSRRRTLTEVKTFSPLPSLKTWLRRRPSALVMCLSAVAWSSAVALLVAANLVVNSGMWAAVVDIMAKGSVADGYGHGLLGKGLLM